MKTLLSHLFLIILFILFLIYPIHTLNGAASGLLLWYNIVLPTLFPFIVVTSLIVHTGAFRIISTSLGPFINKLFSVSQEAALVIIIGFLCGYPMGAKVINDLYKTKCITLNEAKYLLSFCNNTSPMFIISFFLYQILEAPNRVVSVLIPLYLAPIIMSLFTRRIYLNQAKTKLDLKETTLPRSKVSFSLQLLDSTILDSITLILKIGGYIILFSIIISLSYPFTKYFPMLIYIIPLLEITNGITIYHEMSASIFSFFAMIFLISMGGLCAAGQTKCVLSNTPIKITHYLIQKIITAIIAVIISFIIYSFHFFPI